MAKRPAHSCDNLQRFTRFQRSACDMAMTLRCQGWDDGSAKLDLRSKTNKKFKQLESDHQFDMFLLLQNCPFSVYVWFSPDLSGHIQSIFWQHKFEDVAKSSRSPHWPQWSHHHFPSPFRIWGSNLWCGRCKTILFDLSKGRLPVVTLAGCHDLKISPTTRLAIAKFDDLKNVSETDVACSWNFTCY